MRPLLPALLLLACAPARTHEPEIVVVGTDYAFAHPDTLPAGPTTLAFENRGRVHHELMLAKLKRGVTLEQALAANQAGDDVRALLEDGASVLYASPGGRSTARLLVDLEGGAHLRGRLPHARYRAGAPARGDGDGRQHRGELTASAGTTIEQTRRCSRCVTPRSPRQQS